MGTAGVGDTLPYPHPRSDTGLAETAEGRGGMAMANQIGWLIYTDGEREYATPYPYSPETFRETCHRAGWAYRQVPFIPVGYTGYYVRWGYLLYLLNMDTQQRYGFLKRTP